MTELREKIALEIREAMWRGSIVSEDIADRILAIPEIAKALSLPDNQS